MPFGVPAVGAAAMELIPSGCSKKDLIAEVKSFGHSAQRNDTRALKLGDLNDPPSPAVTGEANRSTSFCPNQGFGADS